MLLRTTHSTYRVWAVLYEEITVEVISPVLFGTICNKHRTTFELVLYFILNEKKCTSEELSSTNTLFPVGSILKSNQIFERNLFFE